MTTENKAEVFKFKRVSKPSELPKFMGEPSFVMDGDNVKEVIFPDWKIEGSPYGGHVIVSKRDRVVSYQVVGEINIGSSNKTFKHTSELFSSRKDAEQLMSKLMEEFPDSVLSIKELQEV